MWQFTEYIDTSLVVDAIKNYSEDGMHLSVKLENKIVNVNRQDISKIVYNSREDNQSTIFMRSKHLEISCNEKWLLLTVFVDLNAEITVFKLVSVDGACLKVRR